MPEGAPEGLRYMLIALGDVRGRLRCSAGGRRNSGEGWASAGRAAWIVVALWDSDELGLCKVSLTLDVWE